MGWDRVEVPAPDAEPDAEGELGLQAVPSTNTKLAANTTAVRLNRAFKLLKKLPKKLRKLMIHCNTPFAILIFWVLLLELIALALHQAGFADLGLHSLD